MIPDQELKAQRMAPPVATPVRSDTLPPSMPDDETQPATPEELAELGLHAESPQEDGEADDEDRSRVL